MASCVKPECISTSRDLDANADMLIICIVSCLLNQDSLSNEIDGLIIKIVADRGFTKKFAKLLSDFSKNQAVEKWNKGLQMAVLSFSDQQVLTGLAILISGYVQLGFRGLAVYHWQIVVDLAFFSSVTHLRLIRLICMGVIATMLGCALWSTGYLNGDTDAAGDYEIEINFPAWCLYHREAMYEYCNQRGGGAFNPTYVVVVLLYLGFSYLTRLLALCPEISDTTLARVSLLEQCNVLGRLRKRVRDKAREANQSTKSQRILIFWILIYRAILSIVCLGQAVSNLYGSVIWEVGSFDC